MLICQNCGKEFAQKFRSSEKFCSTFCRKFYHRQEKPAYKVCEICGKGFEGKAQRYCSPECRYQAQLERQRAYKVNFKKPQAEVKEEHKKKRGRKKKLSLAEINELARAEGLNYGQYVAKYGL